MSTSNQKLPLLVLLSGCISGGSSEEDSGCKPGIFGLGDDCEETGSWDDTSNGWSSDGADGGWSDSGTDGGSDGGSGRSGDGCAWSGYGLCFDVGENTVDWCYEVGDAYGVDVDIVPGCEGYSDGPCYVPPGGDFPDFTTVWFSRGFDSWTNYCESIGGSY
jgi:hypothetical protein